MHASRNLCQKEFTKAALKSAKLPENENVGDLSPYKTMVVYLFVWHSICSKPNLPWLDSDIKVTSGTVCGYTDGMDFF